MRSHAECAAKLFERWVGAEDSKSGWYRKSEIKISVLVAEMDLGARYARAQGL